MLETSPGNPRRCQNQNSRIKSTKLTKIFHGINPIFAFHGAPPLFNPTFCSVIFVTMSLNSNEEVVMGPEGQNEGAGAPEGEAEGQNEVTMPVVCPAPFAASCVPLAPPPSLTNTSGGGAQHPCLHVQSPTSPSQGEKAQGEGESEAKVWEISSLKLIPFDGMIAFESPRNASPKSGAKMACPGTFPTTFGDEIPPLQALLAQAVPPSEPAEVPLTW